MPQEQQSVADVAKGALSTVLKLRRSCASLLHYAAAGSQRRLVFIEQGGDGRRELLLGSRLGEGGYSTVWRVRELQPDGRSSTLVVKRAIISPDEPEQEEQVQAELDAMRSLPPHPNILALVGSCRRAQPSAAEPRDEVFMLLEYCRTSLATQIQSRADSAEPFRTSDALRITIDTLRAIAHLHAQAPTLAPPQPSTARPRAALPRLKSALRTRRARRSPTVTSSPRIYSSELTATGNSATSDRVPRPRTGTTRALSRSETAARRQSSRWRRRGYTAIRRRRRGAAQPGGRRSCPDGCAHIVAPRATLTHSPVLLWRSTAHPRCAMCDAASGSTSASISGRAACYSTRRPTLASSVS